jgi:hypothetical protein
MVNYNCNNCGKIFKQKAQWIYHTQNKKFPCETKFITNIPNINFNDFKGSNGSKYQKNEAVGANSNEKINKNIISCRFCLKQFLYTKNLNKHIREERCEVLKLQKQQKENIFINLIEEEKIVNQTKKELNVNTYNTQVTNNTQMEFLIKQIKSLNDKLEEQKKEKENEKKQMEEKIKLMNEKNQKDIEEKLKLMTERYKELEKNNTELKKTNEKLQNKVNKIVNKNKITNTNTNSNNKITNTVINNPTIKLVNFGSEDLDKISYNVFIDTIKSQGAALYNKALEGIHFNKDHPENQNIYISDFNRDKVMIYRDEKWFLDNWDNIFPILLEKVIHFGYDKEQFLKDCNYNADGKKFNKQMIRNAMRWYKLLDNEEADIEYFGLDVEDRPKIDEQTLNDYLEMQEFRKKHPKKSTESNVKNKMKLNIYNKREIPINNWKQLEDNQGEKMLLIDNNKLL